MVTIALWEDSDMEIINVPSSDNIIKVKVKCHHCGKLTDIDRSEEDYGSAIINCHGCRSNFIPEYEDGMYLTRCQYTRALTRNVQIKNGMVNVFGSEHWFGQYSFFCANVIIGKVQP